jgi:hypothetical protein
MNNHSRTLTALAVVAACLLPTAAAQAQYDGGYAQPAPLYPYAVKNSYGVQADQPYAVEVAPNTYVIQRGTPARAHPYAGGPRASNQAHKPADRGLIEELRNRGQSKGTVINTTKIVRRHIAEDAPVRSRRAQLSADNNDTKKRVIQADAEVTILGPDRMSIRLFRKGHNAKASAQDE